jgi:hypothetical protein
MENIIEPTFDFDFSKLYLGSPISTSRGTYFTKILYNNKSLYVQTPKSLTKQGFIKSGKKVYTDLMFTNFDNLFIDWLERLQNKCEELLYERGQSWFETKLEKDDIETAFTSPIKVFKSGKNYLIRVNTKHGIKIYDEFNNLVELESITNDKNIISILEIQGITFTSKNFQIEIELKQCMTVSPDPFLEKCFIKNPNTNTNNKVTDDIANDIFLEQNMFSKNSNISENNETLEEEEEEEKEKKLDINTINLDLDDLVNTSITNLSTNLSINLKNKENENKKENKIKKEKEKEKNKEKEKEEKYKEKEEKEEKINLEEEKNKQSKPLEKSIPILLNENISLEFEDIIPSFQNTSVDDMTEVDISLEDNFDKNDDAIKLKNREQVYKEIYQKAKDKVKELKNATIVAYMELKNIKSMYMLDDVYNSDSDIEELDTMDLDTDNELNLEI